MKEVKQIFCNTTKDLPTLEFIKNEMEDNDQIRIDYSSKFKFLFLLNLRKYIHHINKNLNVEIHKGQFKNLKFYNIYKLFSESELDEVSKPLEMAVKNYKLTCEKLIKDFEHKYNYSFTDLKKSFSEIRQQLEKDNYKLSKHWSYRFHGGDVCFSNSKTGQIVEINLKYKDNYGVLDLWFFQYYIRTTEEFKSLNELLGDNTPKLIQALNFLKENGKLKLVKSEIFDFEKLISA